MTHFFSKKFQLSRHFHYYLLIFLFLVLIGPAAAQETTFYNAMEELASRKKEIDQDGLFQTLEKISAI